jgi:DNA polymerase lambda
VFFCFFSLTLPPPAKKQGKGPVRIFVGCVFILVEKGMTKTELGLFVEKIDFQGGKVTKRLDKDTTHIITSLSYEEAGKWLNSDKVERVPLLDENGKVIKMKARLYEVEWLTFSLGKGLRASDDAFRCLPTPPPPEPLPVSASLVQARPASPDDGDGTIVTANIVNERPCPPCYCGQMSVRTGNRIGVSSNTGRMFIACPKARGQRCGFFEWLDEPPKPVNFAHFDAVGYDYRPFLNLPRVGWAGEVAPKPAKEETQEEERPVLRYVDEEAIPERCKCAVCQAAFIDPRLALCQHRFCLECIAPWLEKNATCPLCRKPVTLESLIVEQSLLRLLGNLEVHCPNAECDWTGARSDVDLHWSTCRHNKRVESDEEYKGPRGKRPKVDPSLPPRVLTLVENANVNGGGSIMVEEEPAMMEEEEPPRDEEGPRMDSAGRVIVDDEDEVEINQRPKKAVKKDEVLHRLCDVVKPWEVLDEEGEGEEYAARPDSPPSDRTRAMQAFVKGRVYSQYTPPSSDEELLEGEYDEYNPTGAFKYLDKDAVKPNAYLERNKNKWLAANPNAQESRDAANLNKGLSEELKKIALGYEAVRNQWKARAHNNAASAVAHHPREIKSIEEAQMVNGVGPKILVKIVEYLQYGATRKTRLKDDETKAKEELGLVHGVGPKVIDKLWMQGIRSLAELRANSHLLTPMQQIGLKYVDEFRHRIPRAEVAEVERKVKEVAARIDPRLKLATCGSYRRGKKDSGDIDMLITHKNPGKDLQHTLGQLVEALTAMGLVTDALTHSEAGSDKWMGVCQLRPDLPHRRLDFQLIARESWPFALLYFTGSEHFNRSMRHWAGKLGLSLSQHALVTRTSKKHEHNMYKKEGAVRIQCKNERDVFAALKLKFVPPNERDV